MLDNKAKISDIISSLQESEGINQKAELKSILVDKGITVEDTNDMASIVSKVNELVKLSDTCIPENIRKDVNINGIIGTLDLKSLGGKRYASGSTTTNSADGSFSGSLTFKPSIIIAYQTGDTSKPMSNVLDFYFDFNNIFTTKTYIYRTTTSASGSVEYGQIILGNSGTYINETGFKLTTQASINLNWIAIE